MVSWTLRHFSGWWHGSPRGLLILALLACMCRRHACDSLGFVCLSECLWSVLSWTVGRES